MIPELKKEIKQHILDFKNTTNLKGSYTLDHFFFGEEYKLLFAIDRDQQFFLQNICMNPQE